MKPAFSLVRHPLTQAEEAIPAAHHAAAPKRLVARSNAM